MSQSRGWRKLGREIRRRGDVQKREMTGPLQLPPPEKNRLLKDTVGAIGVGHGVFFDFSVGEGAPSQTVEHGHFPCESVTICFWKTKGLAPM